MKILKILFFVLIIVHAFAHLPGFLKAYKLAVIDQLNSDISKSGGLLYLAASITFLVAALLYLTNKEAWMYFLLFAAILSSILIFASWHDARYGMIPNVIIISVASVSLSSYKLNRMIAQEKTEILSRSEASLPSVLTGSDLKTLPVSVQEWLSNSGATGRPLIQSVRIKQKAEMRLKPSQDEWYTGEAEQFVTTYNPAFIWTVQMTMSPFIHMKGRDKFTEGKAAMLIRMNSVITIVNEKGKKLDEAALQRFLAELVWYPTMALSPYITWEAIDDHSARATMTYRGTTGSGVFYFNTDGQFEKFIAMRYKENKPDAKQYEWIITANEYATFDGLEVPSRTNVTWRLEEGDWTWLRLRIEDLKIF